MIMVDNSSFESEVLKAEIPVLVDFYADWCGPCRMMAPAMEQLAAQAEPDIRVAKLNTDEARQTAARFGIQSIPTVILFRNGMEAARQSGAMNAGQLAAWINSCS